MKGLKKTVLVLLSFVLLFASSCSGNNSQDGSYDESGNYKPSEKGTILNFWGWGDSVEGQVFNELTKNFNETIGKQNNITVKYNKIPSNSYETTTQLALNSNNQPDIVYVADGSVKSWVEKGYLTRLDDPEHNYLEMNGGYDLSKIWPSAIQRYRYDPETTTSNSDDPLWGLPKDIGPTVIFYNADYIRNAGITIISVPESEIASKIGTTIEGTNKTYTFRGYDEAQGVFNNQIAMSWEETVALAKKIMKTQTPANSKCDYGFFTEWWFSYGWSVGGDCMEYVTDSNGNPYYKFTLGDTEKNYIVKDDIDSFTVAGGGTYKGGEIISYTDKSKLTEYDKEHMVNELPSQREAFTEFCRLSASTDTIVDMVNGEALKGYGVAMNPTTVANVDYASFFYTGRCGMYVDGRWAVSTHRQMMRDFDWDVCPLPVYRRYGNEAGTVVEAHGIPAGHSGSVAVAIPSGSKNKDAAWLFVQYVAGEIGQSEQSKQGFAIPNQMELSLDEEIFLQTDKKPKNSQVFVDAALYERPGDWTYLKDGEWIAIWATPLNTDVRDGKMDITTFFETYSAETQNKLYTYNGYKN